MRSTTNDFLTLRIMMSSSQQQGCYNRRETIMMKAQAEVDQMVDERTQFLQKWLSPASSHQSRDSQHFLNQFFRLVQQDPKTQLMFVRNLSGLLQSHQANLVRIFQYCLQRKDKVYAREICAFVGLCLDEKNQVELSWQMEKYLIHHIWRNQLSFYLQACNISAFKIMQYLSLKMRSLNSPTRYEAVVALFDIIEHCQNGLKSPLLTAVQQVLPQMIEKQNYGKQVCFYRGVLLQVLEDQLCHIKKKGIQLLGKAQKYLDSTMIRPLILYMLNDEHQAVREACLTVLSQIPSLDIEKEDLSALLVCLKQNNTLMRSYTYQNLSHINVTSAEDFRKIIQRLLVTLSSRNEDKKKIYIVCSKLGRKYPNFVLANLQHIYKFTDDEEPNWKSIVYRARFITLASIGTEKWPKTLPKYFNNHYLYIRDVLLYAFEQKISDSKLLSDLNEQTLQEQSPNSQISINLLSSWQIYQYIEATSSITEGFPQSIFCLLQNHLQNSKLLHHQTPQIQCQTQLQIQKLSILYNINSPLAQELLQTLSKIIAENSMHCLAEFLYRIREEAVWKHLEKVQPVIFKISSTDRTKIVISNIGYILKRSFVQFGNGQPGAKDVGYLRMSLVDFEETNQKICYFRINFKCKQIRCFILYGDPPQYHVTQPYTQISSHSDWLTNLVT